MTGRNSSQHILVEKKSEFKHEKEVQTGGGKKHVMNKHGFMTDCK